VVIVLEKEIDINRTLRLILPYQVSRRTSIECGLDSTLRNRSVELKEASSPSHSAGGATIVTDIEAVLSGDFNEMHWAKSYTIQQIPSEIRRMPCVRIHELTTA
jgi:hypothetical protein